MADSKISNLTSYSSPNTTSDLIAIVDSTNNITKKITPASFTFSQTTKTIATQASGFAADYYTDGIADDVEIQAAIIAVNAAGGGIIVIREGTYNIVSTITLLSNITVIGSGWSTILQMTANTNRTCMTANVVTNLIVKDLQIDMNATNNTTATSIKAIGYTSATTSSIINVYVKNMRHVQGQINVGIGLTNCTHCLIHKNYVYNVGDYGFASNGLQYCTISNNFIQNPAGHGINLGPGAAGGAFERPTGNIIQNNIVYYDSAETLTNQDGLKIGKCDQTVITGNIFYCNLKNGGSGIVSTERNVGNVNNTNYQQRNLIANNTFYGFGVSIYISGSLGDTITGNTIQIPYFVGGSARGMLIRVSLDPTTPTVSEETQIVGNIIYEETSSATSSSVAINIDTGSQYINISGNTIYNMSGIGILFADGTNYCKIGNNTIKNCRKASIYLGAGAVTGSSHCNISDNLLSGNSSDTNGAYSDIELHGPSTFNTITGNTIATPNANKVQYGVNEVDSTCNFNYIADNNIETTSSTFFTNIQGTGTLALDKTAGSFPIPTVSSTATNGANFGLIALGATNPRKFIRSRGGSFQIIDDAYTNTLLTITNAGLAGLYNITSPNSSLQTNGAIALPITTKSANYTITSTDSTIIASGSGTTITLPTAVGITGRIYIIKRNDTTNNITVATTSSQTIDGVTTLTLNANFEAATVQSDGANWQVVGQVATVIL